MTQPKHNFTTFFPLITLVLLLVVACTQKECTHSTILDSIDKQQIIQHTAHRTTKNTKEGNDNVKFSVIYTGDLDVILQSPTSSLSALIETYEFQLSTPFKVGESMRGIILHSYAVLDAPLEIAKEISNCEEVLMVEVQNLPETKNPTL